MNSRRVLGLPFASGRLCAVGLSRLRGRKRICFGLKFREGTVEMVG